MSAAISPRNKLMSRYNKLLFVVDTCQANTMYSKFYSPNVISSGSSELGENSYSVSGATDEDGPGLTGSITMIKISVWP